jgi:hypothetical protein
MMRGSEATPSRAVMRPLVIAGPMWRASIAPKVFVSTLILFWAKAVDERVQITRHKKTL